MIFQEINQQAKPFQLPYKRFGLILNLLKKQLIMGEEKLAHNDFRR